MKTILWLVLALLTLISFEYHYPDASELRYNGVVFGAGVLVILFIFLLFKNSRAQKMLLANGVIKERISTPYDLIPYIIFIPFLPGMRYLGDLLPGSNTVHKWTFEWGLDMQKGLIFLGILLALSMYKNILLLRKIAGNSGGNAPN